MPGSPPPEHRPRRRVRVILIVVGVLVLVPALIVATVAIVAIARPGLDTTGRVVFDTPLAIPPLAPSTVAADGTREFELDAHVGATDFGVGGTATTWGFSSGTAAMDYLGPTLRASRGERVRIRVTNDLDEATSVHWHRMHLPPEADGGPHAPIAPGETWTAEWTVDQPAATLWYHPHPHGATEAHVQHGLAGMFLLDDPESGALPLPHEYGVDDIPVIVQDAEFDAQGALDPTQDGFTGALGDRVLVDGTLGPYLDVTTELVRLRLLNASTARIYRFGFDDGRDFDQIASDGGLLEVPNRTDALQLAPGERAEIVVAMRPGETTVLRSGPQDLGAVLPFGGDDGSKDRLDVLELRAAPTLDPSPAVPAALTRIDRLDPARATAERRFDLDGTQINQRSMDMSRIDEVVQLGATEIWDVENGMAFPHDFHVHDVQFQILTIAGAPPPPDLAGWKDTIYLRPNERYRLIMQFTVYASTEIPYMFHCHLLRHEDEGMMGQFLVVEPGTPLPDRWTTPDDPTTMEHDHEH